MAMTDNTTWTGDVKDGFFSRALTSSDALNNLTLLPGIKSVERLASFDLGNILQPTNGCTWAPAGEGTLEEKSISVCPVAIQLEFCTDIWEQNYKSVKLSPGSSEAQIPADFESYLVSIVADTAASNLETTVFRGDTATASYPKNVCDGLIKLALADSDVVDITATASTLNETIVITELDRILEAMPFKITEKKDFQIFISQEMAFWYKRSLKSFYIQNGISEVQNYLIYLGYKLIPTDALSGKEAFAMTKSNVFYATDLDSDVNQLKVIDMSNQGERNIRIAANFKFGVNYLYGEYIGYYR